MAVVGDHVVFVAFGEPDRWTQLKPGTHGVVTLVDDAGTVHVKWDDGSSLGMVSGPIADRFVVVPPPEPCPDCGAEWDEEAARCSMCPLTIETVAQRIADSGV